VEARLVSPGTHTGMENTMISDQNSSDDDMVVMVGRAGSKELHEFRFPAGDFEDRAGAELTALSRAVDLMRQDGESTR
jgi:hypothetical protein